MKQDREQKELVRLIQDDLPVVAEPFAEAAERLNWPHERVVKQVAEWLQQGVIRRFGAVVQHRRLGFRANGMAVFRVASDRIDALGRRLAEYGEVSHCYRRLPPPDFNYNLFAMIHGRSETQVREFVDNIARELGVEDYQVLFSIAEYKKISMRYFLEDRPCETSRDTGAVT